MFGAGVRVVAHKALSGHRVGRGRNNVNNVALELFPRCQHCNTNRFSDVLDFSVAYRKIKRSFWQRFELLELSEYFL